MDVIETTIKKLKDWIENPLDYRFEIILKDGDSISFDNDRKAYDSDYYEIGFIKQIIPIDNKILMPFQSIYTYNGYIEIGLNDIESVKDW